MVNYVKEIEMNKMRVAVKMDVELNVVDEFCSNPLNTM